MLTDHTILSANLQIVALSVKGDKAYVPGTGPSAGQEWWHHKFVFTTGKRF